MPPPRPPGAPDEPASFAVPEVASPPPALVPRRIPLRRELLPACSTVGSAPDEDGLLRHPLVEQAECLRRLLEREAMRDELVHWHPPLYHEARDGRPLPEREVPGADQRQHLAQQLVTRVEGGAAGLADECDCAAPPSGIQGRVLRGRVARAVDGHVHALAAGQLQQPGNRVLAA